MTCKCSIISISILFLGKVTECIYSRFSCGILAQISLTNAILIFKRPTLYEIMFNSLFGGGVGTGLIWVQDLKSVLFDH